jgi:glutathione peroxidase
MAGAYIMTQPPPAHASILDIPVRRLDGTPTTLSEYEGKVLLIVNVASRCGFTPQYAGLEKLYQELGPRGLVVLGFPCNQFGGQEPGSEEEIQLFCDTTYHVTFPLFAKVEVNGNGAHMLWKALCAQAPGILGTEAIKWNFTKFLVDRKGRVIDRFAPATTPESLRSHLEAHLG